MGAYLSSPVTNKVSDDDGNDKVKYGVSGMQGWRVSMEDAHICQPSLDKDASLFAVFDGHGGSEVAEYCASHFQEVIKGTQSYKDGNIKQSLIDAFLFIDERLTKEEAIAELKELAGENKDEDGDADEAEMLAQEANMPIEDLLKRIKEGRAARGLEDDDDEEEEEVLDEDGLSDDEISSDGAESEGEEEDDEEEMQDKDEGENNEQQKHSKSDPKGLARENAEKNSPAKNTQGTRQAMKGKKKATEDLEKNGTSSENVSEEGKAEEDDSVDEEEDGEDGEEEDDEEGEEEEDEFEENDDFVLPNSDDEVGKDSGTTAIVVLLQNNHLYVANAGDSRAVLCREGKAVDLSEDHKPEDAKERERIEAAGGKISADGRVNGGLNLSRAIGDHAYKKNEKLPPEKQIISAMPDVEDISLTSNDDFLILACDGIWNVLTSQQAVDFVKGKLEEQEKEGKVCLSTICEDLFDKCLAKDTSGDGSGCDNMTCIIVLFSHNKSRFSLVTKRKRQAAPVEEEGKEEPNQKRRKTS